MCFQHLHLPSKLEWEIFLGFKDEPDSYHYALVVKHVQVWLQPYMFYKIFLPNQSTVERFLTFLQNHQNPSNYKVTIMCMGTLESVASPTPGVERSEMLMLVHWINCTLHQLSHEHDSFVDKLGHKWYDKYHLLSDVKANLRKWELVDQRIVVLDAHIMEHHENDKSIEWNKKYEITVQKSWGVHLFKYTNSSILKPEKKLEEYKWSTSSVSDVGFNLTPFAQMSCLWIHDGLVAEAGRDLVVLMDSINSTNDAYFFACCSIGIDEVDDEAVVLPEHFSVSLGWK
ncbi:hypothetical protein EV363DRAFT_1300963 [Boletus edulis]|nr:hypothetical protein EV363DRAFT_1300963 [Boletus edulis]